MHINIFLNVLSDVEKIILERRTGTTEFGVNYCNCKTSTWHVYSLYVPICFTCTTGMMGKALSVRMDQNNNKRAGPVPAAPGGNGAA